MRLFDWLRKPKGTIPLPELCYDIAYFVLPTYAFFNLAKVVDLCLNSPSTAGSFFYDKAARKRRVVPRPGDAEQFRWHHGQLRDGRDYFILEFPTPPSIDGLGPDVVLAPYFVAILRSTARIQYFILGQSPGDGTTLRCIDGRENCNLGSGPEPTFTAFLNELQKRGAGQGENKGEG